MTICSIATPTGGALGIIRISGPDAITIADNIFRSKNHTRLAERKPYTAAYGEIADAEGNVIDQVMCTVFRAPHSFTGEDAAEITCHGSAYIMQQIINLLIQHHARQANPGEFTQRAFLNGKIDLSQAEAVADLIASSDKATHHMAMSQLKGHFSSELAQLRSQLLEITSLLELELDFSDHEDLEFADRTELLQLANRIDTHITHLADTFEKGQALKNGIAVAIVGKTNVGKSTLLNKLLKEERAIVSSIHGTTRDIIEDQTEIEGLRFRFSDTAGLRHTTDEVEQIGIQLTHKKIQQAHIILWLIDTDATPQETEEIQQLTEGKHLIIAQNKADTLTPETQQQIETHLRKALPQAHYIRISAKTSHNIPQLQHLLRQIPDIPEINENDIIVNNARHYSALLSAHESLTRVIQSLAQNLSGDLIAEDLRQVLHHIAQITGGEITPQETLNNIFSHFCVGK